MCRPALTVSPTEVTDTVPTITEAQSLTLTSKVIGPDIGPPLISPSQPYTYTQSPPCPSTKIVAVQPCSVRTLLTSQLLSPSGPPAHSVDGVGASGDVGDVSVNVERGVTLGRPRNSRSVFRSTVWIQPVDAPSTVRTYTHFEKLGSYPMNSRTVPAGRV